MLLGKFIPLNSLRYADFAEQWRKHKFSLIFCGRKRRRELHYMIDEMIPIVLKLWTPSSSILEKVFALYMLYAIYEVQPLPHKIKIRLQQHHWNMMGEIFLQCKTEQHLDACFIIGRMRLTSCFHFVAYLMHRTPARLGDMEDDTTSNAEATTKVFANMGRLTKDGLLEQLSMIHSDYMSMKAEQDHPGIRQLDMAKDDIFSEMYREVSILQAKYRGVAESAQNKSSSESSSEDEVDSVSDVGTRRHRLRMRQYANKSSTRYGTRYQELLEREEAAPQVDASRASSSKEGLPSPPARKKGKTSKKEVDNHDTAPGTSAAQDATSDDQPQAAASGSSRATKKSKKRSTS